GGHDLADFGDDSIPFEFLFLEQLLLGNAVVIVDGLFGLTQFQQFLFGDGLGFVAFVAGDRLVVGAVDQLFPVGFEVFIFVDHVLAIFLDVVGFLFQDLVGLFGLVVIVENFAQIDRRNFHFRAGDA